MLFNIIFNTTQTVVLMCYSLMDALCSWSLIVSPIKNYNGEAFRKSAYKKKNLFAKLFLRGLEHLTSKFDFIMNFIEKIVAVIFLLFCILNLSLGLSIFSDIMLITGIMQFTLGFIIWVKIRSK